MKHSSSDASVRAYLSKALSEYLTYKPFFYGFIRPQEVYYFRKYAKYIKPPILDFGADDGFFAKLAFETPLEIGLDLPGTGLESDRANNTYKHRLFYDGGRIPLKNESVQTIVSNCVFEHIADLSLSLSEMYRVLKPGGYLLTSVMADPWDKGLLGKKILGHGYSQWLRAKQVHHNLLSKSKWLNNMSSVGFRSVHVSGYVNTRTARYLEIGHYIALPQHLWVKITHSKTYPMNKSLFTKAFMPLIRDDVDTKPEHASALFFVMKKE